MEILTSVVGKVADYTVVPIGRQASYLIFYNGKFKMLEAHVNNLHALRERMFHLVEEERGNGKEIERDVLNWLEKVNEVIERANQLQKDPRRANARCSSWGFPNLILRYQQSRKATKIANNVIQVEGEGTFDRVGYLPALDRVASSSSIRGGEMYETRESIKEKIVKALSNPNSRNIGIYGLGGVGKTTLVEEVTQIAKQLKLFDKVVITHVSLNPDFKTIQGEIADLLGLRFDEETIFGRANRLRQRIKMEKSILVILDNIWSMLDLKKVGIPIGNEHNGCKLLMTCRNLDVLLQMDVPMDFTFKLERMSENETWKLFQFMAGDVVKDNNLKDVAIQVAQKCEGLPLRVVTVARAMRNKRDIQSWKDALRKLQCNDHTEMDSLTYSALELSYNLLESDEMRDLFLLFALMEGNNAEYFLKVAMGLNILKHVNTIDEARNKLYTIIRSLEVTCLLLDIKRGGMIQMHDFVHDFAIYIARRDKHVFLRKHPHEEWPTKDFLKRCTQIALSNYQNVELPQTIYCPNIKFFYLLSKNRALEIPNTFFEGMRSLSTLDLTQLNLSSLPTSFRFLTGLKTLCLDFCILENMHAIQGLQNLEILCISKSSMIKFPSEIGKLTQLRMLDLSNSGIEVLPSNIISNLINLEELYMGNTSINWEDVNSTVQNGNASIAELQKLPNLTALELQIRETWMLPRDMQLMFEKLNFFKIAIGDVWEWADIEDGTLKTLMLKLGTNIHLEHGIKALIKSVENLYLDDVDGIQNVLYQLNGEGFPLLKHLHVQNNANMKHIVDSEERNRIYVSFPILETLVLHNLKNLEHICHGPLSIISFGSLSVIKVKNCIKLKCILSFTMIKGLSRLSEIDICECNSVKEIVLGDNKLSANNDITNENIEFLQLRSLTLEHLETLDNFFFCQGLESSISSPFFNAQVVFPNLHTLKLSSLPNLNKIWDDSHHSMYNLTNLTVDDCGGLEYLFSSAVVASFKNLKLLKISSCPMMEEIIAEEERDNALEEVHFLKLEKIILLDMDNLKTIWHRQFETVKMLDVAFCEKIVVVFPSSMQNTYNKLEMLKVEYCVSVEEIFELTFDESNIVEDTTQLKEVSILFMPKLKKIWSGDPQEILSFQNLINVKLEYCKSLEYLLPLSVATRCSHLKELHITECENIKEIVAEEKESSMNVAPIFEFNQLSTLLLRNLGKLEGLYAKKHTLVCPSLKRIDVFNCTKLNLYRALSTRSSNFLDDQLSVLAHQPLFIAEEVIPTLEMLRIDNKEANMLLQAQNSSGLFTKMTYLALCAYKNEDTFPYLFLQNAGSLESLSVEQSCFEKIFQDEGQINETTHTRLKNLYLIKLPKLQHICGEGSQIDPVLEVLQVLWVTNCSSLINLLPSSATLSHLEYMDITDCKGLKNLITSPTMQSLHKLRRLKVENCCSLEEVITGEENIHITLISLEELVLKWLPRLNQFCSKKCFLKFPLLEVVIVRDCPRMKVFSEGYTSTPNLQKVQIVEDDEEWFWKGNINDTITSMFEDKEVLLSNTLNETISSHLEDEELGSKNGVDTDLEE
ncbi:disease resistance protein [Trifolium repens]|nr:disease resistance protein [Trifolium repens]